MNGFHKKLAKWTERVTVRCFDMFHGVRREVFTAMKIQDIVFWVVTLCRDVVGYQHFRGSHCFQSSSIRRNFSILPHH